METELKWCCVTCPGGVAGGEDFAFPVYLDKPILFPKAAPHPSQAKPDENDLLCLSIFLLNLEPPDAVLSG